MVTVLLAQLKSYYEKSADLQTIFSNYGNLKKHVDKTFLDGVFMSSPYMHGFLPVYSDFVPDQKHAC